MNKTTPRISKVLDKKVETWWDDQSRNWITQTMDKDGCREGDAAFSGSKRGAQLDHNSHVRAVRGLP